MSLARLVLAAAAVLAANAGPAALAACDPSGADAAAIAAARRTIDAACACHGPLGRGELLRCVDAQLALLPSLGDDCRRQVRKVYRGSSCGLVARAGQAERVPCCTETDGAGTCAIRPADRCRSGIARPRRACADTPFCADADCGLLTAGTSRCACEPAILYSPEGNRLRRFDLRSVKQPPLREDVLIEAAPVGLDINGQVCPLPDGSGRFVAGEDTGQPAIKPGWGVFAADGTRVGKLTPTTFIVGAEPFGCAFEPQGRLFTIEVGNQATGPFNGQLILWFPPYDVFPGAPGTYPNTAISTNFCKIAIDLGTPGAIAVDELGRVHVPAAREGRVRRFAPPFPTAPNAAGGCGATDSVGSPLASATQSDIFIQDAANSAIPTGIVRARNGNWYVSSVLTGTISEYTPDGAFVRRVLQPVGTGLPLVTGHPQGLAVDCEGDLYYADLRLVIGPGGIGPGPDGRVWRIAFDAAGNPLPPEVIRGGLAFPDGLGVLPGSLP